MKEPYEEIFPLAPGDFSADGPFYGNMLDFNVIRPGAIGQKMKNNLILS